MPPGGMDSASFANTREIYSALKLKEADEKRPSLIWANSNPPQTIMSAGYPAERSRTAPAAFGSGGATEQVQHKSFMNHLMTDIQAGVFRVVAETFPDHVAPLSPQTLIKKDLGADSMQLISLMIALDAEFDAEFAVENIPSEDVTLEWVCRFVHETLLSSSASA